MKKYLYNQNPFPMKHVQMLSFVLFVFLLKNDLHAQCNPDVTPPIAICENGLVASLGPNGQVTLWASDFDDGSNDNCSTIDLFMEEGLPPSSTPPTTQSLDFDTTDIGLHDIVLWVVDSSGNTNTCVVTLEIETCQGNQKLDVQ